MEIMRRESKDTQNVDKKTRATAMESDRMSETDHSRVRDKETKREEYTQIFPKHSEALLQK